MARRDDVVELLVDRMERLQHRDEQRERIPRDIMGRTANEARRDYLDFSLKRPTFERGKTRWNDFAHLFRTASAGFAVTDAQAREVLYGAIIGQSSRLVIASMNPTVAPFNTMTIAEYLDRMGEKFSPAAESIQMEAEYKARRQGKHEDVQNYINAKHELFQLARPNAQARDVAEFYNDTTEGFLNKYVRDQMFCFTAENVTAFGARAVTIVQIERRRIKIGDSETKNLDGLVPVTRAVREHDRGDPMEIDTLGIYHDEEVDENEEDLCECMALHEGGFRGPCYYCYRQGHMARNCPRKSAGLPKVTNAYAERGQASRGRPIRRGMATPIRGRFQKSGGNREQQVQGKSGAYQRPYRVNQLEEHEVTEEEILEDEEMVREIPEDAETHFLGSMAL